MVGRLSGTAPSRRSSRLGKRREVLGGYTMEGAATTAPFWREDVA
jgi:hypothetical protein